MAKDRSLNWPENSDELHNTLSPAPPAAADQPAQFQSPPESVKHAGELLADIKEALTKDAEGQFPAKYAEMDLTG